jgi:hypothetical protein
MRPTGNASALVDIRAGDNVTFVLAAKTTSSWLALGLSRDGTGMKGMDVALLVRDDVRGHVVTVLHHILYQYLSLCSFLSNPAFLDVHIIVFLECVGRATRRPSVSRIAGRSTTLCLC